MKSWQRRSRSTGVLVRRLSAGLLLGLLVGTAIMGEPAGATPINPTADGASAAVASAAIQAAACGTMTAPVYQRISPASGANLLTPSLAEANWVSGLGFTDNYGLPFRAAAGAGGGLRAAHRLFAPGMGDLVWMTDPGEIAFAQTIGYVDQGTDFHVSSVPTSCAIPVHRYWKAGLHRFVVGDVDRAAESAAGWLPEGIAFYAAPPAPQAVGDTRFSIAVYPDTQNEVLSSGDRRFADRTQWVIDNRLALDTRFLIQTGDLVNWDTPTHDQYARAKAGLAPLGAAGIPFAIAIGNHDTAATCQGGSACPDKSARITVRDTSTMNRYFPVSGFPAMRGEFEPGKIDNAFSTFSAGGRQWLVLTLELWPRTAAIDWASSVVASHPDDNVIIATHSYLDGDGSIYPLNGGYGSNSPQYLYDNLIRRYPNIRLVFSGHAGIAGSRLDTGDGGNSVASFLGTFHSATTNPVRVVDIDTASNSVSTRFYAPFTQTEFPEYGRTVFGLAWVG